MSLANRDAVIIKLNPSVVSVIDGVPYDADNNVVSYDAAAVDTETNLQEVRMIRNVKLAESDWTQMADSSLTDSVKAEWATYRQSLRDITDSATSLDDVTWPEKP